MTTGPLSPDDLPAWMRPRQRSIDWGWVVVLACGLLLCTPLALFHGLPRFSQAETYGYRSLEIKRLVQSGTLYSRWAPDFYAELGSPLFNYIAPLPHYLAGYHQAITESDTTRSIKLFLALSILTAGSGMYFFAQQRWGIRVGLIAAFAYLFSTPVALSLPYLSGDLGLLMSVALLPWAAFGLDAAWRYPRGHQTWLAAVCLAAFILTDARTAFLGCIVLLLNIITIPSRFAVKPSSWRSLATAVAGGLALSAFFWLPGFMERGQIRWIPAAATSLSQASSGAIPLTDSLLSFPLSGAGTVHDGTQRGIGLGTATLALLGAIYLLRKRDQARDAYVLLAAGAILLIAATPLFAFLWPSSTGFMPLQPYHAVLVAIFCLCSVAGQALRLRPSLLWMTFLTLCLVVSVLPVFLALNWPASDPQFDFNRLVASDRQGSLDTGLLLPAAAPALPEAPATLLVDLQSTLFQRLNPRRYFPDMQVGTLAEGPMQGHYIVNIQGSLDIEIYTFAYPGWAASINGSRVQVQSTPEGLVKIMVTSEAADLSVWFEGTTIRVFSWGLTWLGVTFLFWSHRQATRLQQYVPPISAQFH